MNSCFSSKLVDSIMSTDEQDQEQQVQVDTTLVADDPWWHSSDSSVSLSSFATSTTALVWRTETSNKKKKMSKCKWIFALSSIESDNDDDDEDHDTDFNNIGNDNAKNERFLEVDPMQLHYGKQQQSKTGRHCYMQERCHDDPNDQDTNGSYINDEYESDGVNGKNNNNNDNDNDYDWIEQFVNVIIADDDSLLRTQEEQQEDDKRGSGSMTTSTTNSSSSSTFTRTCTCMNDTFRLFDESWLFKRQLFSTTESPAGSLFFDHQVFCELEQVDDAVSVLLSSLPSSWETVTTTTFDQNDYNDDDDDDESNTRISIEFVIVPNNVPIHHQLECEEDEEEDEDYDDDEDDDDDGMLLKAFALLPASLREEIQLELNHCHVPKNPWHQEQEKQVLVIQGASVAVTRAKDDDDVVSEITIHNEEEHGQDNRHRDIDQDEDVWHLLNWPSQIIRIVSDSSSSSINNNNNNNNSKVRTILG